MAVFAVLSGCGGGGGGSTTGSATTVTTPAAPVVALASPAQGAVVSDVDFLTTQAQETFEISISYAGASAMDFNTLAVTFKMDNGAEQAITSYFSKVSKTSIKSSGLNQFTSTLFPFQNDTPSRTMTVKVSIRSQSGATASATSTFYVVPGDAPVGPETPPAPPAS